MYIYFDAEYVAVFVIKFLTVFPSAIILSILYSPHVYKQLVQT